MLRMYHSNFLDYTSPFVCFRNKLVQSFHRQLHQINSGELTSVIPKKNYTTVLSLLGRFHQQLHQNTLRQLFGVINFTSVTPEISRGINFVILEGPMIFAAGRIKEKKSWWIMYWFRARGYDLRSVTLKNMIILAHTTLWKGLSLMQT